MGKMISLQDAESHLRTLIGRAENGEEIVISEDGRPIARIVPVVSAQADRVPGIAKGDFALTDAFFEPLPEDELAAWGQ